MPAPGGIGNWPSTPSCPSSRSAPGDVCSHAKPAQGMRLSLCMIVRDEEEMLPRTLEAIKPAVDEIIIVDTGSTDATIAIAESFGATVIEREWTGSFSDARNASLEAATGDWFLYLDADEVLVSEDVDRLRGLVGQTWREAFFLHETNFTGDEGNGRVGGPQRIAPVPQPAQLPLQRPPARADRIPSARLPTGAHHPVAGTRQPLRLPGRGA